MNLMLRVEESISERSTNGLSWEHGEGRAVRVIAIGLGGLLSSQDTRGKAVSRACGWERGIGSLR